MPELRARSAARASRPAPAEQARGALLRQRRQPRGGVRDETAARAVARPDYHDVDRAPGQGRGVVSAPGRGDAASLARGFGLLRSPLWFSRNRFLPVSPDKKPESMLLQVRALLRSAGTGPWLSPRRSARKMPTDVLASAARALLPKDMSADRRGPAGRAQAAEGRRRQHRQDGHGDAGQGVSLALRLVPQAVREGRRRHQDHPPLVVGDLPVPDRSVPDDRAVDFGLALARSF